MTVTATDAESGVDKVEYSLDGGPYLAYTTPVIVDRVGSHTVAYRATDKAGNTSQAQAGHVHRRAGRRRSRAHCPEYDERLTVIVGTVDSGVPNRITRNRCTHQRADRGREGVDLPGPVPQARRRGPRQAARGRCHRPARVQEDQQGGQAVEDRQARPDRGLPDLFDGTPGVLRQVGAGGRRFVRADRRRRHDQRHHARAAWACCGSRSASTATSR